MAGAGGDNAQAGANYRAASLLGLRELSARRAGARLLRAGRPDGLRPHGAALLRGAPMTALARR